MIIDKNNKTVVSGNPKSTSAAQNTDSDSIVVPQQVPTGGIIEVTNAIMEILSNVRWLYGVSNSEKIFKTIQWNDGQFQRIVRKGANLEYEIGFPAAFVHFVNTRYLTSQARIGEGRADLRIQFILNRLNTHDKDHQLDHLYVAERIDQEINLHKGEYDCLSERCKLVYWDFPESFDNGLQPGWLTYEIWFRESSIWIDRLKTYRKIVFAPFTNHSDQSYEDREQSGHDNSDHPVSWEDGSKYDLDGLGD